MRRTRRDRGVALVIVLFLSAVLTLLLYAFLREMQVEHRLAAGAGEERQARHLAWSGIEKAVAILEAERDPVSGPAASWWDNPTEWYEQELSVVDAEGRTAPAGAWSLLRAGQDPDGKCHFGIADESSRVNLNLAPRDVLMKLPGMTAEIADAILDWRDADENITGSGAENGHYQSLTPPYACKNGNFDSVEELLHVKGVTPELLFGEDHNRNGVLDPGEDDGEDSPPADNRDGILDLGWEAYLTVHSYDKNTRADGSARVNINTANPQQLQQALGNVLSPQELQAIPVRRVALGGFKSTAQLMTVQGVNPPGISPDKWKQVVDRVTIVDGETVPGLLNVNSAGRKMLELLPGLTADDVSKLLEYRTKPGADLSTLGWLVEVLPASKIQQFGAFVTTRAWQFRFDAVGRIGPKSERAADETSRTEPDPEKPVPPARVICRVQAVWDKAASPARLLWAREATRLGLPYPVQEPDNAWTTGP